MFPFIVKTPGSDTVRTELPALLLCTRKGFVPRGAGGRTSPACCGNSASRAGWLHATQHCQQEPQAGSKMSRSQPAFFVCCALQQKEPSPSFAMCSCKPRRQQRSPRSARPARAWAAPSTAWQLCTDSRCPPGRGSRAIPACFGPPRSLLARNMGSWLVQEAPGASPGRRSVLDP